MAYQFQPIGTTGGRGLPSIQVPKLQAAPKLQTGTPIVQRDKVDSKDQLTGALLGMLGPSIGRLGVEGLGALLGEKAPDWLRLEEQDPRVTAEAFDDPAALAKMSLPERETFQKQRELIDQVLPKYETPKRMTGLGRLVEGLGTYAPSFLLDEDAADSYIKGAQASAKRFGDYDDSVLEAALARLQKRGEVMANLPSGEQTTFEGAIVLQGDNKPTQVSRTGVTYDDGRKYVLSQGNEKIDLDAEGRFVEAGKYYKKPSLTASLREQERGTDKYLGTFINAETGVDANAYEREVFTADGLSSTEIYLRRSRRKDDGSYVTEDIPLSELSRDPNEANFDELGNSNWQRYQYRYDLAPAPKNEKEATRERFDQLREYENSAEQLAAFVLKARQLSDASFTNVADFFKGLDSLGSEFEAFVGTLGGRGFNDSVSGAFTRKEGDAADLGSPAAIRMYGRLQTYLDAQNNLQPNDPRLVQAQNQFIKALEAYEAEADDALLTSVFSQAELPETITDVASDRVVLKALQIQMAYMAAATAGQTGRTLSDKDLAFFLQAIGFGASSNPKVIKKAMASFIGDMVMAQPTRDTFTREFIRNPQAVNNYLRDELRISGNMLSKIQDSKTSEQERKTLIDAVEAEIQDKTGSTRFIRFDPTTNQFRYFGLFEMDDLVFLPEFTRQGGILDQEGIPFRPADLINPSALERGREAPVVRPSVKQNTKPDDFSGF